MAKMEEANSVKPEKFSGENFKRWQTQVRYWLTVLGVYSAIDGSESTQGSWMTKEQIEYHCYHRILSTLSDHLYDVYLVTTKTAKELWNVLEAEYGLDDAGINRFTASTFNNYKMVDGKPIGEQIHEFKELLQRAEKGGITDGEEGKTLFSEDFKVSCLIDKLPPSWSGYARELRHKQGILTLTQAINSIRVEEKHRDSLPKPNEKPPKVNLVENGGKNNRSNFNRNNHNHRFNNRRNNFKPRRGSFNRYRFNQNRNQNQDQPQAQLPRNKPNGIKKGGNQCYVCGKTNHFARDCYYKKDEPIQNSRSQRDQVNVLEENQSAPFFRYGSSLVNFTFENHDWWLDSGANVHVCFDRNNFKTYQESSGGCVTLGNNSTAQVHGIGDIELKMTSGKTLILKEVRHVPEVRRNLVSGVCLVNQGYKVVLESNLVVITRNDVFIGKWYVSDGLFKLNVVFEVNKVSPLVLNVESCDTWHGRLGHISMKKMKRMMDLELIPKSHVDFKKKCEICVQAKQTRKPHKSVERDTQLLELIHSDVCDSTRPVTRGGNKYFLTFIDDCSRYCYIYLIPTKDEVFSKFKIYKTEVENQIERKIKVLRSDRGGEYTVGELTLFCEEHGIIHEVTPSYSPQSNGIAERKNRTLMDMVNAMLLNSGLPENLWGEAILTACFILNRVIVNDKEKTPYEIWKKRAPNLGFLRMWGCLAKLLIPDPKRKK